MEKPTFSTYSTDYFPMQLNYGQFRVPYYACPDLLTLDNLGVADNLRGKVIRGFFRIMRLWRP